MQFINCTYEEHAASILDIFNDAILHSTALYDYEPRTIENMVSWFHIKTDNNFPIIGVVDDTGQLLGFASYGTFRAWPAYKYTVEHAVYVHKNHKGKGLGQALLERLIVLAAEQDIHVMVGAIDMSNTGSIALHQKLGFMHSGTMKQAAYKFGRWLDFGFYQLILETPRYPIDG